MNAVDLIRRLHQHRQWVNRKLVGVAERLSKRKLHDEFEIGQGSIWKSLLHLYCAEHVWLEALRGVEDPLVPGDVRGKLPGNQAGQGATTTLRELTDRWSQLDRRWNAYLDALRQDALDETVYKISTSSGYGNRLGTKRADILLHVCTHAQYTTSQVVNMMRHVGVQGLPDPMLISMARAESIG